MSRNRSTSRAATATRVAWGVLLLAAMWVGVKVSWQIRHTWSVFGADHMADHIFDDVKAHPYTLRTEPTDLLAGLAAGVIVALIWIWRWSEALDRRTGAEYGSARWSKRRELAPLANKDPVQNLHLTRHVAISADPIHQRPEFQRNLNALVVGGTGSGKSRRFILPNIALSVSSMIVTDPKAELFTATHDWLTSHGWTVRQLNLLDMDQSDGFNALAYLRPGHEPEDIEQLAKTIVTNTADAKPTGQLDPFWDRAENALLTSVMALAVCMSGDQASLPQVADLIADISTSGHTEGQTTAQFESLAAAVRSGDVHPDRLDIATYATRQWSVFRSAHVKTADSIVLCAGVRLSLLSIPAVSHLMRTDQLHLDQVGHERTVIFVMLPDSTSAFSFITALFFQTFFTVAFRDADTSGTGRLPIHVKLLLDEFANIGVIPEFASRMATMRGRNMSAQLVVQNLGQIKARYGDDAETIIGNCDTLLCLGTNDKTTAKEVSERIGRQTIISVDSSEQRGSRGGASKSRRTLGRDLITADELLRMPRTEALVLVSGFHPLMDEKLTTPDFTC